MIELHYFVMVWCWRYLATCALCNLDLKGDRDNIKDGALIENDVPLIGLGTHRKHQPHPSFKEAGAIFCIMMEYVLAFVSVLDKWHCDVIACVNGLKSVEQISDRRVAVEARFRRSILQEMTLLANDV